MRYRYQFVRIHQQSQRDEHHNLPKPGKSVEEGTDTPFMNNLGITENQTGYINSQITIPLHQRNDRKRKERTSQNQDRIQRSIINIYLIDQPYNGFSKQETSNRTDHQLQYQHQSRLRNTHTSRLDNGNQNQSQHISHRVVTTTFQFQGRTKILLQQNTFTAQNGENRSRIG